MSSFAPPAIPGELSPSNTADSIGLRARSAALVATYAAGLLLIGLGSTRVLTYHEVVFAEPAKEMLATGQWVIPTIAGVPFLDKPPATAWLIGLAMSVFQSHNEMVVRLPSACAGVFTAVLVAWLAARYFSTRVGVIAGLVQATMYYALQFGRLAESDILLVAAVSTALCLFAAAVVDGPTGRRSDRWIPWAFHMAAGSAFLIKGPIALVFIGSACCAWLIVERDRRALRVCLHPGGLAVVTVLVVSWPIAAYLNYPPIADAWLFHNVGRFSGNLGQSRPFWFYLTAVPVAILPWTPFALVALYRMVRDRKSLTPIYRFTLCWMLPGLLFLSASAFKSRHYAAPLMPPMALLAAVELNRFIARRGMRSAFRAWLLAGTCMTICVAGAIAVLVKQSKGQVGLIAVLTVIAIGIGAITWLGSQRRVVPQFAALFATVWLAAIGVLTLVLPYHDSYRDQAVLARNVNRQVPANAKLYLLRLPDNQVTYYLSSSLVRVDDEAEAFETVAAEQSPQVYALAPEFLAQRLAKLGRVEVLGRCASVNRYLKQHERMTFIRLTRVVSVASSAANHSQETCR